jgi:hypothetical protein
MIAHRRGAVAYLRPAGRAPRAASLTHAPRLLRTVSIMRADASAPEGERLKIMGRSPAVSDLPVIKLRRRPGTEPAAQRTGLLLPGQCRMGRPSGTAGPPVAWAAVPTKM